MPSSADDMKPTPAQSLNSLPQASCGLNTIAGRDSFYAHGTKPAEGQCLSRHMSASSFRQYCFLAHPGHSVHWCYCLFCREVHHYEGVCFPVWSVASGYLIQVDYFFWTARALEFLSGILEWGWTVVGVKSRRLSKGSSRVSPSEPNKIQNPCYGHHQSSCTVVPFGVTYEKIGTIQRRLAWPLHKDDTLSRSGRSTDLNIYFAFLFLPASMSS